MCKNDQLQFEPSMFSQFSQFNQFSQKTQNLTFIDIKYVLYHNKRFFLYKKGLFCNKYQEIILDFSNLRLKKCNLSKAKITYFGWRLLFLGKDYIFWAKITKNKHLWQHNGPKWLNWLYLTQTVTNRYGQELFICHWSNLLFTQSCLPRVRL